MYWLKTQLKSSLLALLGSTPIASSMRNERVEHVRQLMLNELGEFGDIHFSRIVVRVRYALDAQALWFMRGEIMTVLSAMHGENIAQEKIKQISKEFIGLLPKGLIARSSSLK